MSLLLAVLALLPASAAEISRPAPIPALPASAVAGAKKVEAELRVPLMESGYLKIMSALTPAAMVKTRQDTYLDYHDGTRFLLKRQDPPIKIRVMEKEDEVKTQVSWPVSREAVSDGGLTATVAVTEAREGNLTGRTERELKRSLDGFFQALPGTGPVETLAARAGAVMDGADWNGKDRARDAVSSSPNARLLPAARNNKERRKVTLTLDGGESIEVTLGVTDALDEQGRPVKLYELEHEAAELDPAALKAKARRLLDALRRLGLTAADLGGATPDAFVFTESRLGPPVP